MKTLLILRHAKSSWNYPELSDYDRPLNRRGKRDAPRMGKHLRQEGIDSPTGFLPHQQNGRERQQTKWQKRAVTQEK